MDKYSEQADVPTRLSRRRFLRLVAGLGATGAMGQLLAACGTAPAPPAAAPTSPAGPTSPVTVNQNATPAPNSVAQPTAASAGTAGGTFVFSRASDSDNLDPVTQDGNIDIWIFMSIYDQLVRVNEAGTALEPGLAEKWEVSPDGLTY
ncbi:MAG TPA: hypothetical protein VGJ87_01085, partial [Roseiflexaceae bacterium]